MNEATNQGSPQVKHQSANQRSFSGRWARTLAATAATLVLGSTLALAQHGDHDRYNDQQWGNGPDGYSDSFHEQRGHPMLGARQGWIAGQAQGESDREHHHSNRPTHVDTYRHVPESPDGYSRDQFKNEYRDAFVKGYERGYDRG